MRLPATKGFTLIELTVVLAIAGLLFAVSVPNLSKWAESRDYREAIRQIVSAANSARAQANRSNKAVDLIFELEQKTMSVVAAGGLLEKNKVVKLPESLTVSVTSAAALSSSKDASVIRFYPAGGASGGDIEVVRDSGAGTLIQIGWLLADVRQTAI
jgi:general secretion pathway protein H